MNSDILYKKNFELITMCISKYRYQNSDKYDNKSNIAVIFNSIAKWQKMLIIS